ncbi:hypothetical protein D5W64_13320 [Salmonella enterica subsp. enterica serovar Saintpaul]|nr:hypothetical protein [Salmonella enterica subsp. enterica serovar Saintpaul]
MLEDMAVCSQLVGVIRQVALDLGKGKMDTYSKTGYFMNDTIPQIKISIQRMELNDTKIDIHHYLMLGVMFNEGEFPIHLCDIVVTRTGIYLYFQSVEVTLADYLAEQVLPANQQFIWVKLCVASNHDLQLRLNELREKRHANKKNGK